MKKIKITAIKFVISFLLFTNFSFAQSYNMTNGTTVNTCSGNFYDSGGPAGNYANSENMTMSFCACNGGNIKIKFTAFNVESCCDALTIYNGPNTSSPVLGTFTGTALPGGASGFTSSGTCLTFKFTSDASVTPFGWAASISCVPSPTVTASGPTTFCSGGNVTLTASSGTAYSWSTGATTQDITVTTSGNYFVAVTNAGCSNASSATNVAVITTPTTPGSISGTSTVCSGSTQNYSIGAVSGATTYTWTVPAGYTINSGQGSTLISVTTGTVSGTISVTASNMCGTSAASNKLITIVFPLSAPGPVSGSAQVCSGSNYTYSIPVVASATAYTWVVPTGYVIQSGQNTTSMVLTAGVSSGTISITATNACGVSPAATYSLTVSSAPAVGSGTISGPATVCGGSPQTYTTTAVSGATVYTWAGPAGSSITGGQGTVNATVTFGSVSGSLTVTPGNGCGNATASTYPVTVNPAPAANAGPDITICPGGSATLTASGGTSYAWSPATGLSNAGISNPVATPAVSTSYTVTVTGANSCTAKDAIMLTVNDGVPSVNAGADVSVCSGSGVTLNGMATGNGTYQWSPAAGLNNANISNPTASPASTTTYTLTVTNSCGSSGDAVTVTVTPLPTVNAGSDVSICPGDSIQLNATGSGSFNWAPSAGLSCANCSNPMASPGVTTTYTLTVTNSCGSSSDEVTVAVTALPTVNAGSDVSICIGDSIQLNAMGSGSFNWAPSAGLSCANCSNPMATPGVTMTYTLTVTNSCGSSGDEMTVTVIALPTVNAGNDISICAGDSIQLNATGSGTFNWMPATGLSCTICANPVANPNATTTYIVTLTDVCGSASDTITVMVDPCNTNGISFLNPNTDIIRIIPNPTTGIFKVQSSEFKIQRLEIQNVLGEKVFETTQNPEQGIWNCDLQSRPAGMYFVKIISDDKTAIKKIVKQ